MASASSSSSAVRTVFANRSASISATRSTRSRSKLPEVQCRAYATAAAVETQTPAEPPLSPRQPSSSSRSRPFPVSSGTGSTVTPSIAQSYLSHLLRLPESRQFPPDLALQILTHKSYRHVHAIRHARTELEAENERSSVPHNSRLSFLGRRAIASYLALFVHEAVGSSSSKLKDIDFLRGRSLEEKLEALRHVNNLGREVGRPWDVQSVMRWDRNQTGTESGHAKITGMAVESVLGGIFTQYGSSAAHRAFHLHLLPHLTHQFRDQALKERIEAVRSDAEKQYGGGVLLP